MSENVKIGGIRKNPAIDKINCMGSMTDVKKCAVEKMEEALLTVEAERSFGSIKIPVDFAKADWGGEKSGQGHL